MEGRQLKDHVIQIYQIIKQILSPEEREYLYRSLADYKRFHDAYNLALELCQLCTTLDRVNLFRNVWTQIIHGQLRDFDRIMKEHPGGGSQNLLKVNNFTKKSKTFSQNEKLFDEDNARCLTYLIKVHKRGDSPFGFCIRGGLEHGLGIYISGIETGSVAEESGLEVGDKILEVNNISLHRLPSSSAVKVLTGSNQLKMIIERIGRVPEWRLSRERTVWFDCETKKLTHGDFEENSPINFIRGIDVDIPERCITFSNVTDDQDLGFNITGGNEYQLGIYVSQVNENSKAEQNGIQVGDQIIEVNGIQYDNISHAHAVEILKNNTHLIITLRDVGKFPAYKEIYAEYTWTGTSDVSEGYYSGERLIERKLPDTWIESNGHHKKKNLHLRVPVQVISHRDDTNGPDPLHPEIYLPENDELSHVITSGSSIDSDSLSLIRSDDGQNPVDHWIGGRGHSNPGFHSEMGDNSSIDNSSGGDNSCYTESDKNSKLDIHQYIIHKNQDDLDAGSGRKSVERYIFDNDDDASQCDTSLYSGSRINEDDLTSVSRESLVLGDDNKQSYHSNPSFSTFNPDSTQNREMILTSLDEWRNLVKDDSLTEGVTNFGESNTDGASINFENDEITGKQYQDEDVFTISIVPGSVGDGKAKKEVREGRFKKKDYGKTKNSKFKSFHNDDVLEPGNLYLFNRLNESTDDCIDRVEQLNIHDNCKTYYKDQSLDSSVSDKNNTVSSKGDFSKDSGSSKMLKQVSDQWKETDSSDDRDIFDKQIHTLENRKSELGMYEMTNMSSSDTDQSSRPNKKERRGSLFKAARRKSADMASKRNSWKVFKKKIRSGLFKKTTNGENVKKVDFVWSKYNPNTFDEEGLGMLENSAHELFDPDDVMSIIRHIKKYHGDHDVDRLVEYLQVIIDVPEKILILKDVRKVIYKFDMFHFDELVKQFEIDAYEKLSTSVHLQLNHDKRRKPKKHLLQPETDDFGHFFIKPTNKQKEGEQDSQRQVIDVVKNDVDFDHQAHVTLTFNSDELIAERSEENNIFMDKYGKDIVVGHISKQKQMLGLCISGGIECKQQPQIKVDEVIEGGAAADEPRIQPGMIILAIDNTDMREVTHTDAILTLKKSFSNKTSANMTVVLTNSVVC